MARLNNTINKKSMRKKKEPDKLALDMMQCKADGFGCHYGQWKALQDPVAVERKIPEGWLICPECGKSFKHGKYSNRNRIYCDITCQKTAQRARDKEKRKEYYRSYAEKRRAEKRKANEQ